MISWITILLFFVYLWGFGFTALYYFKKPESLLERHSLYLAIGLGIFPIIAILINFFHLPILDWKLFLIVSIAFPLFIIFKKIKAKQFSLPKLQLHRSDLYLAVVLFIVIFSLYMYLTGAFSYPYLEDEDPWGHAVGVKYVAMEKIAYDPDLQGVGEVDTVLSYIDPYPPAYNILLGILHQTSPDLKWTLKFFNAIIISLGFLFFYLFVNKLLQNKNKALLATFILASIPSYLGHFIWAHSLVITIFFPTMYAFLSIKEDQRWWIIAALAVASIWVSQNIEQPLKLTTMLLIFIIVGSVAARKWMKYETAALGGGIALSFLWWGTMLYKYGFSEFLGSYKTGVVSAGAEEITSAAPSFISKTVSFIISILKTVTNPGGTASRAYTLNDFVVAEGMGNMINTPVGIGLIVSALTLLGVGYLLWRYKSSLVKEENFSYCLALFWLIFTFWAVNGMTFPISVAKGAFRSWFILAIAVSLIATEGIYFLRALSSSKAIKLGIVALLMAGIFFTSATAKYEHNTIPWPTSGSFTNPTEPVEYAAWFKTIPLNTPVFLYSPRDKITIGLGGFSCDWCQDIIDFRKEILNKDVKGLNQFLKQNHYQYFIINGRMDSKYFTKEFGEEKTKELLQQRYDEIFNAKALFTPVYQKDNLFVVFKVN